MGIIFNKPSIMGYMDIKMLVWIPVDNKYSRTCISHVKIEMLYIIKIISCNTPIDYIHYRPPYFTFFVCWYWSMSE